MASSYTESSHQGYFSRLAGSFIGVLIGFLLVPGSVLLIGWNEYRTVHRTRGLIEAEQVVEEVKDPHEIDPAQHGKLVHLSGKATTEETLQDKDFGISRNALRLGREVEMYQWVEKKETHTREKIGGGRETVTTYKYDTRWSDDREESERFKDPSGHTNPPLKFHSAEATCRQATLGAFQLSSSQVERIDAWQDLDLKADQLLASVPEAERARYLVEGNRLYVGDAAPSPQSPKVGDLRIRFRAVDPTDVSILAQQDSAQQDAARLAAFTTHNGEKIDSIETGVRSTPEMFASLRFQNTATAMILRGVGWLLACVGFGLITGPLSALAGVLPFMGRIVGAATFFVSLILGSAVALVAIGVAWIAVRPLYAIILFALAAFGLYVLFRNRQPKAKPQAPPPMAQLVE